MDNIFERKNYVTTIAWRSSDNSNNDAKQFSRDNNSILVYSKGEALWQPNKVKRSEAQAKHFSNSDNDPRGPWFDGNPIGSPNYRENLIFDIVAPNGNIIKPPYNGWRWSKETMKEKMDIGEIYFNSDYTNIKRRTYLWEQDGLPPSSFWYDLETTGHNRQAKSEMKKLFSGRSKNELFSTPKPEKLLKYIMEIATNENDLVLDFFMGSATTQAVAHKIGRKYIGIEQMDYIETVSVSRLQKVIEGERGGISKDVNWQGGGSFVYAEFMPKNKSFVDEITRSKTSVELSTVLEAMKAPETDIDFRADLEKIDLFDGKLTFIEQKQLLIKVLDKNQLYYNYSELEDKDVSELLEQSDIDFNHSLYENGGV
jgi:adenine-specific DNA-methyltransferase